MGQNRRTRRALARASAHRCEHVERAPSEPPPSCPSCGCGSYSTGLMFGDDDGAPWPLYCVSCGDLVAVL
jgi:hypothetical protein